MAQWILDSYNSIKDSNKGYNLRINFKVIPKELPPEKEIKVIEEIKIPLEIVNLVEVPVSEANVTATSTETTETTASMTTTSTVATTTTTNAVADAPIVAAEAENPVKEQQVKSSSRSNKRGSYDPIFSDYSKRRSLRVSHQI